jgi:hypothetical protein
LKGKIYVMWKISQPPNNVQTYKKSPTLKTYIQIIMSQLMHATQFKATLKNIRKGAREMNKKRMVIKKLAARRAKFAKRCATLKKKMKQDLKKQVRRYVAEQKAIENKRKAEARAAARAAKQAASVKKKTYKPRRSKDEIASDKAAKLKRAEERLWQKAAKMAEKDEKVRVRAEKKAAKMKSTRKNKPRRTKEEIKLDIMKAHILRMVRWEANFKKKFNLSKRAYNACVRAAKNKI